LPSVKVEGIEVIDFKIKNPFFKGDASLKDKLSKEISTKKLNRPKTTISPLLKPTLITDIPNFENKLFLERLTELDISKEDNFKISKKIPLENPNWKFEEED
jgi:hypothetical protein